MPVVFIGHGNPMNALADNAFTRALRSLGESLPRPKAILCVSAHWMTEGFALTANAFPDTIHDFNGFPPELHAVRYEPPGDPALAADARDLLAPAPVVLSEEWGLDHGAWSVLRHIYPAADVPVVQLSIDPERPASEHYALGRALRPLRERGVLILGSGNIVHNLRRMQWRGEPAPEPWATEFDSFVAARVEAHDDAALTGEPGSMPGGALSVPTPDHWLPFVVSLGAADDGPVSFPYTGIDHAAISMRCFRWG